MTTPEEYKPIELEKVLNFLAGDRYFQCDFLKGAKMEHITFGTSKHTIMISLEANVLEGNPDGFVKLVEAAKANGYVHAIQMRFTEDLLCFSKRLDKYTYTPKQLPAKINRLAGVPRGPSSVAPKALPEEKPAPDMKSRILRNLKERNDGTSN